MKTDVKPPLPTPYNDMGIFERLDHYPDTFTDEELDMLLRVYSHSPAKGRNAQIPAKAFLILEKRRKPLPH